MQTYIIDIGVPIPGPNDRMHWRHRSEMNGQIKAIVATITRSIRNKGHIPAETNPARLELVWHRKSKRHMDRDNLLASMKYVIDGLVDGGALAGDSPKWLPDVPAVREVLDTHKWGGHQSVQATVYPLT